MFGKQRNLNFSRLIFGVTLCVTSNIYAQEIPFDPNVPDPNPPATTGNEAFAPSPDEQKTPPELEIPLAPLPVPKARTADTAPKPDKPEAKRRRETAELAGLGNLSPFEDIAVISKRYLPKTNRFEFFPNAGLVLNDAFFNDVIFSGRLAYYLTEQYGLELSGMAISASNKQVTNELATERGVGTQALATPTAYFGADFKWSPIYGKIAWVNKTIVPFDLYFSGGGGITQTNQSTSPPTLHLGVGQLFAIQKWFAFRWDISWYAYNSSTTVASTSKSTSTYTNLHATIGVSFFFPGARYR